MLKLKEAREERELQQKEIAEKLNRTAACISSWETGKTEPSIDDLKRLATILGVSIDYLVGFSDEMGNIQIETNVSPVLDKIISLTQQLKTEDQYQVLGFIQALRK